MISQSTCEFTLAVTTANNKVLSLPSEDFILTSDMYSPAGTNLRSVPADTSVIAQDILSHDYAWFKLDFYFILIDDLDALDEPPDESIIELPFQTSSLFCSRSHSAPAVRRILPAISPVSVWIFSTSAPWSGLRFHGTVYRIPHPCLPAWCFPQSVSSFASEGCQSVCHIP